MSKASLPQTETIVADSQKVGRYSWQRFLKISNLKRLNTKLKLPTGVSALGHLLMGTCALTAAIATTTDPAVVQSWELESQAHFFQLRGKVAPPADVIIVKMDDYSIDPAKPNSPDPKQYAYLELLKTYPWKRAVYAMAVDRLMAAGAKSVAIDLLFDKPSNAGDDQRFRQTLQRYAGRVTLAAQYAQDGNFYSGEISQVIQPNPIFQTDPKSVGSITYPIEPNGRIHRLGSEYPLLLADDLARNGSPNVARAFSKYASEIPSFAEATLVAAQRGSVNPLGAQRKTGSYIYFYGPTGETFTSVSFWDLLDPVAWQNRKALFKDKIVLIGPTANLFQDFHYTPFAQMPGIELNANAIATLLEGKTISNFLPDLPLRGLFVLVLILASGYLQTLSMRPLRRFSAAAALAIAWTALSYALFTQGRVILPTAVPVLAILCSGASYMFTGIVNEKFNLRRSAKRYASSPVVQALISESNDSALKMLIEGHNQELIGKKLNNRYTVIRDLGSGGFGKTYIAEDTNRPGHPHCVVKRLRPSSNNPRILGLAKALFHREADTLESLGRHPQIPQLLAYFEENDDFYLVQEYIQGPSLADELSLGRLLKRSSACRAIGILYELLTILDFVHRQGVIHRDIKPGNVIRRYPDGKLVLIDFGAVKQIKQLVEGEDETSLPNLTVAIGTDGFMAPEQADGRPRPNSDIYSVGIMGIQAVTGISATALKNQRDPETGILLWKDNAQVSHALAEVLDKMVCYNFTDRYQTAAEAIAAISPLYQDCMQQSPAPSDNAFSLPLSTEPDTSHVDETKPWPQTFSSAPKLPPTDPPSEYS